MPAFLSLPTPVPTRSSRTPSAPRPNTSLAAAPCVLHAGSRRVVCYVPASLTALHKRREQGCPALQAPHSSKPRASCAWVPGSEPGPIRPASSSVCPVPKGGAQPDTETGWPRTPAGSQYLLLHGRGAWAGLRLDGLLLLHRLLLELQQLLDVHGLGHDGLPCGQHAAGETRVRVRARIPFPRLPASPSHSDRQLSTKTAP